MGKEVVRVERTFIAVYPLILLPGRAKRVKKEGRGREGRKER